MRYGEKALYGRFSFLEKNGDNGHYCCNEEGEGMRQLLCGGNFSMMASPPLVVQVHLQRMSMIAVPGKSLGLKVKVPGFSVPMFLKERTVMLVHFLPLRNLTILGAAVFLSM